MTDFFMLLAFLEYKDSRFGMRKTPSGRRRCCDMVHSDQNPRKGAIQSL
jgi:hypothetical protein